SRDTGERQAAAAGPAHAVGASAVAAEAVAATGGAERAATIAVDRAAADGTEGVVLANAELGAATTATAHVGDQAETASGERLRRHDTGNNQSQHGGGKQFFHGGGVRECSTGGAGQHP